MLTLNVQIVEGFDNATQKFVPMQSVELELEHSLVSLSKWEQKYEKPFLSADKKTIEETIFYFKCMCLTPNVPDEVWEHITDTDLQAVNEYINRKMSAAWFNERRGSGGPSREVITADLIYYWMVAQQIDWQAQYWHLNTLLTLVKVINHKNQPEKKRTRREIAQDNARINAQRLKDLGTRG